MSPNSYMGFFITFQNEYTIAIISFVAILHDEKYTQSWKFGINLDGYNTKLRIVCF